jgi:hypothetical protein
MWDRSLANQGGFQLDFNTALGITNASSGPTPSSRDATTRLVENTLNWLKGTHSLSFGASFTQADVWIRNQNLIPEIDFAVVTGDPAEGMFNTTNFPGASGTNLADARDLYAILTGRVSSITGNARIDENTGRYTYLGPSVQRAQMRDLGFFAQDSWRVRPNLTLNYGLRYELQLPFNALNDSYSTATLADLCGVSGVGADGRCNLFQPGVMPGKKPEFINLAEGQHAYNIDWNNWAPSVGINWTPTASDGVLRAFLGADGDTSISGGFATSYNRNGLSDFTGAMDDNPGLIIDANRTQGLGNLGTLPLLFRDRSRLGPPSVADTPEYPLTDVATGDMNIFDPNIQVPWTQSWTVGWQRAISRNMMVEARYLGTRHGDGWLDYDYNEINVIENGFLNEFRLAQQNLRANIAAGRGATFAYTGPGTSPLPIFLAYFSGLSASQAGNAASYTSALFRSSTFLNPLAIFNPQPYIVAETLDDDAGRRANAIRGGLPANFFLANPDLLGGVELTTSADKTRYHSLQLILRRRMSGGLQFNTSYVYGKTDFSTFFSFRRPFRSTRDSGTEGEVTHAFKADWVYELPFGRERRFASSAGPLLNRLIGGWSVTGTARIQSGILVDLGSVRMVGFDQKELWDMFKVRKDSERKVWMFPQDVLDNTVKAFNTSATSATGYGPEGPPTGRYFAPPNSADCIEIDRDGDGQLTDVFGDCGTGSLVVRGPVFQNYDLSILKQVPITGRVNAEIRFEVLNAFDNVNFIPVGLGTNLNTANPANPNGYEVTGLTGNNTSRIVQIVARINW